MAFHISHEAAERRVGVNASEVAAAAGHRRLVLTVHIAPQLHSRLGEYLFFRSVREVFKYHNRIRIGAVHGVVVIREYVDAALVVSAPAGNIAAAVLLGETFGEVETETVNMIFLKQISQALAYGLPHHFIIVVQVVEDTERMGCHRIEPRIGSRGRVGRCIPVHFGPRAVSGKVVIDDVDQDGYSAAVALVYEFLVFLACTVCLVKREIMVRIVSPAEVAVEFLNRHKLYRIDPELLEIVQLCLGSGQVAGFGEISEQEFIYDEIVLVFDFETVVLPAVFRPFHTEGGNQGFGSFRELAHSLNILVVPLVIDYLGVRVANTDVTSRWRSETILEAVFGARVQTADGSPPASGALVTLHRSLRDPLPAIPVTYHVAVVVAGPVLVLVIKHECNRIVAIDIDAVFHTRRKRFIYNLVRSEILEIIAIVSHRAELVIWMALCLSVLGTDYHCHHLHRSLPGSEIFAYGRFEFKFPGVLSHLFEVHFLITHGPIARYEHPFTLDNDAKVSVEFSAVVIERIARGRSESDGARLVRIRNLRFHAYARSRVRGNDFLRNAAFSCLADGNCGRFEGAGCKYHPCGAEFTSDIGIGYN